MYRLKGSRQDFNSKSIFIRKKVSKNATMHFFSSFLPIKNFVPRSREVFQEAREALERPKIFKNWMHVKILMF